LNKTVIGSHSGTFHADDVFAVAALSILFPNYEIKRSRDPEVWAQCDYLVDVGDVYDHSKKIYDHHFRNGPTYDDGLRMSSIGLVWKHYGVDICGSEAIANRVCQKLIRALDATDNGIDLTTKIPDAPASEVSLSGVIAMMNPPDQQNIDAVFAEEVNRARQILKACISKANHWMNSQQEVIEAISSAQKLKQLYIEVGTDCNWPEHLRLNDHKEEILFVIYPTGGQWYIRAVTKEAGVFSNRKDLPSNWGGLRDENFSKEAKIPDGVFCHHGLFICAASSRESVLKLVKDAINA